MGKSHLFVKAPCRTEESGLSGKAIDSRPLVLYIQFDFLGVPNCDEFDAFLLIIP